MIGNNIIANIRFRDFVDNRIKAISSNHFMSWSKITYSHLNKIVKWQNNFPHLAKEKLYKVN